MIKAQDLRIGNIVNNNIIIYSIDGMGINRKSWEDDGDTYDAVFIVGEGLLVEGVSLTEEWLERFGFEKEETRYNLNNYLVIHQGGDDWWVSMFGESSNLTVIKYVHHLQNLYHALSGEELTLKTT